MLRQKIGQMLIMGFDGFAIEDSNPLRNWLAMDGLGGVLLFDYDLHEGRFGKNIENIAQIKALNQQLMNLSKEHPLLIALDYEGGAVDRLQKIEGIAATLEAKALAQLPIASQNARIVTMAKTLKDLGFNLNFAPVVDLQLIENGFISAAGRSFSGQPEPMAEFASRFVKLFNQHHIGCCYKHFPGHGSARGDSHLGFVDVTATFNPSELLPYQSLAQDSSLNAMIMTAHVINRKLDPSGIPATLSKTILTDLLRGQMHYEGLIISDDLQMHAISNHYTVEETLKLTINAGADMVIFGNQLGKISATTVIDIVERLVEAEEIPMDCIEKAYQRILAFKARL